MCCYHCETVSPFHSLEDEAEPISDDEFLSDRMVGLGKMEEDTEGVESELNGELM